MSPCSRLLLHLIFFLQTGESYYIPNLQVCSGIEYTSPSTFDANLQLLLNDLTTSTANNTYFFTTKTIGSPGPSQVFGLAQCRLDSTSTSCGDCLRQASAFSSPNQAGGCGRNSSAAFRYSNCVLRYSDTPFFNTSDLSVIVIVSNTINGSKIYPDFGSTVKNLVNDIVPAAALSYFRYAITSVTNIMYKNTTIYAMAWCTMDLPSSECMRCLSLVSNTIPTEKIGGEITTVSCMIRFSIDPFYSLPKLVNSNNHSSKNATSLISRGRNKISTRIIIMGILSGSIALIIILMALLIIKLRMKKKVPMPPWVISGLALSRNNHSKDSLMNCIDSLLLDLDRIRTATQDFSKENMLGEGGFGLVYKGVLEDGQEIAVKRLSRTSKQGLKQLKNEVYSMAKLQHRNLVKLLGCCLKDEENLLVYEYLPNSSLDKYLSDPDRCKLLDWNTRHKIIVGIGRGLLYLHEDSRLRIIHRDLKASNILLDNDLNPKISDFGIAKLFTLDESRGITSQVAGTFGYMSPEYALHGNFSTKSDVYSFGVLVLEIISGSCNCIGIGSESLLNLMSYAWHCWSHGMALKVIDQSLGDRYSPQEALRCIQIGLLCVQEEPALRPCMSSVVAILTNSPVTISNPMMPAFVKNFEV